MAVVKNIEIIASSKVSFDDAVKVGIAEASRSVKHIKSAWVAEQKVQVDGSQVVEFRVTLRVSFVIDAGLSD
jgi:hypothetical protein